MAETQIQPEHLPQLARRQHVLEWLLAERARLEAELQHILNSGQREQDELMAFLQRVYGIRGMMFTLDAERGVITTPDAPPAEPEAPAAAQAGG